MSISSPVIQLGAVSSISGPHSILEIGDKSNNYTSSDNASTKSPLKEDTKIDTTEKNHIQEPTASSTLMNQSQSPQLNDCIPEDGANSIVTNLIAVNKRPPPLEVGLSFPFFYVYYHDFNV